MAQKLTQQQIQEQKLIQSLKLSQQQLIAVRLIEKPIEELKLDIENEIESNPALEKVHDEDVDLYEPVDSDSDNNDNDSDDIENEIKEEEKEGRAEELETALENMGSDDDREERDNDAGYYNEDYKEIENGSQESFFDKLNEQMNEMELTDTEHQIMEYIIGSIDDDGLLHNDLDYIAEQLFIYSDLDVTEEDVEKVLKKLQTFDPAGVGARNLQECLLLQVKRMENSTTKDYLTKIITSYYEEFRKNHWDVIQKQLNLSDSLVESLKKTIKRRLTPKPGYSLGASLEMSLDRITPDFIITVNEEGQLTWEVNNSNMPQLCIDDSFESMAESYKDKDDKTLNRSDREAKRYTLDCVQKGNWYIDALRQRQHTMEVTMKAIIRLQKKYFLDGDEADLKPMKLEDVAEMTGLDLSTISRVSRQKYIQTPWGIICMKNLFTSGYVNEEGEEMSVKKVKIALKEIIDNEDKKKPLSDEALVVEMHKKGFNVARRTIAKYRDQMKIPVARMRKG